ncbi:hypothetical protein C9374_006340 [Naegleria lovaniensis]|uniref:BTB domain-containing protein n=1 Tax=Naegleria lovaniensis TaxID=51637 RepID=A0AA88KMD8_NAELO|nr:uncharacterized protein C9374_006340 [Naegleria lovaniensis]KAG2381351.1 hypothetical protein C9374_006340 [Naegleria lovaniensis]
MFRDDYESHLYAVKDKSSKNKLLSKTLYQLARAALSTSVPFNNAIVDDELNSYRDESDLTISVHFRDQKEPTLYHTHAWIMLARWPLLLEYALINLERPLQRCEVISIAENDVILASLTTNKEIEKYYCSMNDKIMLQSEFRNEIKKLKEKIAISKERLNRQRNSAVVYANRMEALENILKQYCGELKGEKLSIHNTTSSLSVIRHIDLGPLTFDKNVFDDFIYFLYTSKLVNVEENFKKRNIKEMIIGEEVEYLNELLCLAETLGVANMLTILQYKDVTTFTPYNTVSVSDQSHIKTVLSDELASSLASCVFLENDQPVRQLDKLKKSLCDLRIKQGVPDFDENQEVTEFSEFPELSEDGILCHKSFVMKMCPYVDVLINSNFIEAEEIREMEARNEIATVEIQCSSFETLEDIFRYLYSGHITISKSNVFELIAQSQRLGIDNLQERSGQQLKNMEFFDFELIECVSMCMSLGIDDAKKTFEDQLLNHMKGLVRERLMTMREFEKCLEKCGYDKNWIEKQTRNVRY